MLAMSKFGNYYRNRPANRLDRAHLDLVSRAPGTFKFRPRLENWPRGVGGRRGQGFGQRKMRLAELTHF